MQFHTWPFLIFFILTYGIYLALRRTPYWVHALLAASYVFYGWWRPEYLLLILYSTVLDYGCVEMMRRSERNRGWWLTVSIVNNLGILGFFKYAEFAAWNVNWLFQHYEIGYVLRVPDVLLPVGISFFTFQSMSYTIDFYRGRLDHEPSFVRFATFVAFFPQLVAGPIERASCLLPQMRKAPPITRQHLADGMSLFLTGLVKKIALADYLAAYSDPIYSDPANRSGSQLACATFAFAWQIYFDFSGYTDMARGVARVMGFDLMLNFNHPYLATGMKDFWSRWHISLSTWFRDYVYIPLGGNQSGRWLTYRNLMLTMIISGFWHGADWDVPDLGGASRHRLYRSAPVGRIEMVANPRANASEAGHRVSICLFYVDLLSSSERSGRNRDHPANVHGRYQRPGHADSRDSRNV